MFAIHSKALIWVVLDEAMLRIKQQTRNHNALALEVEQMQKLIEDMTRAQQGSPHDP